MIDHEFQRRRSPHWVRSMPSATVHAIGGRFLRIQATEDLTEAQEWLFDALVSELEYRWRGTRPAYKRCTCALCVPAFPLMVELVRRPPAPSDTPRG